MYGDGVVSSNRRRRDFSNDGIRDLTTASERSQPKGTLEYSASQDKEDYSTYARRSNIFSDALRKSDQMHQTFEKSPLAMTHKLADMIELPKLQSKKTYKDDLDCEIVMVKVPKCMSWLGAYDEPIGDMEDEVNNPSRQSTTQVLLSFEVYTPPVTYLEEVDETIGILMEVEPLNHIKLEDLGLNTCSHGLFVSSREVPSVDEPKPQLLPNFHP
ncbi:hypothetical protein Tco_1530902 [Tanacetum coccineum]